MASKTKRKPQRGTAIVPNDAAAVSAPSVRVYTDWTPAKVRATWQYAESGVMSQPATLCEWLLTDQGVVQALSARCDALIGLEPTFDLGVGRKAKQAQKALEAGEDWWAMYPAAELRQMLKWGILLGLAPFNTPWSLRPEHGGRALPALTFWHPSFLRQDQETKVWYARDSKGVEHEMIAGDGTCLLFTPFGAQRPWADGLWRPASLWVLLKQLAMGDWGRHSEKSAMYVASTTEASSKEQRKELADQLRNRGAEAALALPKGWTLDLLETVANTKQIYEAQIEMADKALAILFRGGNLTTDLKEGSHAGAKVQKKTGDDAKLRFDAISVSTCIHDQHLKWWAELNFGDSKLAPWPNYPVDPPEDKAEKATTANTAADAVTKFDKLGYEIDDTALQEEFELPWLGKRATPEERMKRAQEAMTPAEDDDAGDKNTKKGSQPSKAKAAGSRRPGFMARLASGAAVDENRGFVDGQLYADDVVESGTAAAEQALKPTTAALLNALDAAEDFEDLRQRLRALYGELSHEEISELVYRATALAQLAGRYAVNQDA